MLFMAFLATAINYIDRANLSVAMPFVQHEFGLSSAASGALLGAFFWTYAAFQLPSGWFVDAVGARRAYATAVTWWSVFTALMAVGNSFTSLFGLRLMLGVGEAPAYPCNAKVVADWFPRSERALASGIFDSGARVGTALSLPIVTAIIGTFGWRTSFVITGGLGLIWSVVWLRLYKKPREHHAVSAAELAHIEEAQPVVQRDAAEEEPRITWADLFRYRTVWGMMLGFFCLNFVVYFFITWFPTYLVRERGFTLLKLGIFGTLPALFAIVTGWAGGLLSDTLVRRGKSLTAARKIPIVLGMVVASSIALAVVVPSASWALALLALSYGSLTFAGACVWSLPGDVAPTPRFVGSLSGIQNFASNLAGVCISTFVGVMLGRTGGFLIPLLVAGGFSLLGAFSYLFIVGEIAPLPMPRRLRTEPDARQVD
jgi:ACS family D-galactonate transporter-like MFS transporter